MCRKLPDFVQPIFSIVLADARLSQRRAGGCDVDKPRNLAKSVTVE